MRGEQAALLRVLPIDGHAVCGPQTPISVGGSSSPAIAIPGGGSGCFLTLCPTADIRIITGTSSGMRAATATDARIFGGQPNDFYCDAGVTHFRVIQADVASELTWWRSSP